VLIEREVESIAKSKQDDALEQAVDNLINNLDGKSELTDWLIRFAENRVEEGRNWNFRDSLIDLGKEIFAENYQGIDDKFQLDGSNSFLKKLSEYQKELYKIIRLFENTLEKYGNEVIDMGNKVIREDIVVFTRVKPTNGVEIKPEFGFSQTPNQYIKFRDLNSHIF
jgi:hypothetical protein